MQVLRGWATTNIIADGISWVSSTGTNKYFHQMSTVWNVANLGVMLLGYAAIQDKNQVDSPQESLEVQDKSKKLFLVNGVLDFVYIATGLYLKRIGDINNSERQRRYGSAIILQGALLLLCNAAMYLYEQNAGNKLRQFLAKNPITFDGQKIGMIVKF